LSRCKVVDWFLCVADTPGTKFIQKEHDRYHKHCTITSMKSMITLKSTYRNIMDT
jgi:hypothetical protein